MNAKPILTTAGLVAIVLAIAATSGWAATRAPAKHQPQAVAITILPSRAAAVDSRTSLRNIAVAPGVQVRVTITNFTNEFHTFTIPGLKVSAIVTPGTLHKPSKTVFTFTANKWGTFAWYCVICQHGVHGAVHSMGGRLYVIIDPRLLP
jgi:heme/copper-type cytochrome/quinol oxidase subunit 2